MSEAPSSILLKVTGLRVEADERPLLSDFDLTLAQGMFVEVRGANGSGKTTLLRYLAGVRRAFIGSIDYFENGFTYIGQKSGLCAVMTVLENLHWLAGNADQKLEDEAARSALEKVELNDARHTLIGALSAGQVRRCALASLVARKSKIWLLDEPLTALDADAVQWLKDEISQHRAQGGAVIAATHSSFELPNTTTIDLSSR